MRVGVIDSGWDLTQRDQRIVKGVGFVDWHDELARRCSHDVLDRVGHGTACADLILKIAPEARIVPIRVFGHRLETSPSVLQASIEWAIAQHLQVLNLSLGTLLTQARDLLYITCEKAQRSGMIVVAAGHAAAGWSYPAAFENTIGVASGRFSSPFEYFYRPDEALECVAKGYGQHVRWLNGTRDVREGTSYAAPNITGIVALFKECYPGICLSDVRELLAAHALDRSATAS